MSTLSFDRILERLFQSKSAPREVVGTDSPLLLSLMFAQSNLAEVIGFPHLVITATAEEADNFVRGVSFFSNDLKCLILPTADVSPYSGLYPNPKITSERVRWLYQLHQEPKKTIWVANIQSLLQRTLTPDLLLQKILSVRSGDILP